jgi:hypothetical protein
MLNDLRNALKLWGIIKLARRLSMAVMPGKVTNIGFWLGAVALVLLVAKKLIAGESVTPDEWKQVVDIIIAILGGGGALMAVVGSRRAQGRIEDKVDIAVLGK